MGLWRCDKCGLTAHSGCPDKKVYIIPPRDNLNHEWEVTSDMMQLQPTDKGQGGIWGYARITIVNVEEARFFSKTLAAHPHWWTYHLCDHHWKRDSEDLLKSTGLTVLPPNAFGLMICDDDECDTHVNLSHVSSTPPSDDGAVSIDNAAKPVVFGAGALPTNDKSLSKPPPAKKPKQAAAPTSR